MGRWVMCKKLRDDEGGIVNEKMSDEELLATVGMTMQEAERDAAVAESEDEDDGLAGPVYFGSHFDLRAEERAEESDQQE